MSTVSDLLASTAQAAELADTLSSEGSRLASAWQVKDKLKFRYLYPQICRLQWTLQAIHHHMPEINRIVVEAEPWTIERLKYEDEGLIKPTELQNRTEQWYFAVQGLQRSLRVALQQLQKLGATAPSINFLVPTLDSDLHFFAWQYREATGVQLEN